jgi:uncharacterized membrane protein
LQADLESRSSALLDRLIFLSDGVFAIAMTLLAIELTVPALSSSDQSELVQALLSLGPKYLSFLISFLVVASFWTSHQRIFSYIIRSDSRLVWQNVFVLLCIAFQPFPTSVLGTYRNTTAVTFYAGTLVVTGLSVLALWLYATTKRRLVASNLSARQIQHLTLRLAGAPLVFLVSIAIAQWSPDVAEYSWLTIAVMIAVLRWVYSRGS